ncbi:hypothetical protein BDF21DRAFT_469539 [Thamnidium elegans]|nr:hypothetical protein BDF21DRAFT_469539 [Thamnidium elegans]
MSHTHFQIRGREASYINYDKHKSNVSSWGNQSVDDNEEDTVQIDVSRRNTPTLKKAKIGGSR